jgi:hypothetical protein
MNLNKIIAMNVKMILSVILTGFILLNNNSLNAQKFSNDNPFSIIHVFKNKNENTVTLAWNDNRFEEIEIHNQFGLVMPTIPILNAKQVNLNDLVDGVYVVLFKKQNEVVAVKEFQVINNGDIAKN